MKQRSSTPPLAIDMPCADDSAGDSPVVRCGCGSLLARFVDSGLELKCRRCKRFVIVPVSAIPDARASAQQARP